MLSVREILCATDITSPAHAGLRYAFFLADQFQCSLAVVHACAKLEGVRPNTYFSGAERMEHVLSTHDLRVQLDKLVRAIPTGASGRATSHVVEGKVVDAVLARAARQRTDLIVLGSAPRDTARLQHDASVAASLTEQAPCPILTVPARESGAVPRLKRILLALEAAPTIGLSVEWTVYWARRFGAVIQLLFRERAERGSAGAEAMYRHEIEERLRREGVGIDGTYAEHDSRLTERIIERAGSGHCDLVVMSAVGHEGDGHALEELRRQAVVPVLSVRDFTPDRRFVESGFETHASAARQ